VVYTITIVKKYVQFYTSHIIKANMKQFKISPFSFHSHSHCWARLKY